MQCGNPFLFNNLENCEKVTAEIFCPGCNQKLCKECLNFLHQSSAKRKHYENLVPLEEKKVFQCSFHGKPLKTICIQCEEYACTSCCRNDGIHVSHPVKYIDEASNLIEKINKKNIEKAKEIQNKMNEEVEQLKKELQLIEDRLKENDLEQVPLKNILKELEVNHNNLSLCMDLKKFCDDYNPEKKFDVDHPKGIFKQILLNRSVNPKRLVELSQDIKDKHPLIQTMYAEALQQMKDENGKILLQKIIEKESHSLLKESKIALGYAHYCLGNFKEAISIFLENSEFTFIQNLLGLCYERGNGVPKDGKEALKWFTHATDKGSFDAQCNLGNLYFNGSVLTKNPEEAFKLFKKSSDQGFARAQYNLGVCYHTGCGVEKNEGEAVKYYEMAAEQGFSLAQFYLGVCYNKGTFVEKDLTKATHWYRKSAEQGYPQAQYNLGLCYNAGSGVTKDEKEAIHWHQKAAEQGYHLAQYFIGLCYERGTGVERDYEKAFEWLTKASLNGNSDAKYRLDKVKEYDEFKTSPRRDLPVEKPEIVEPNDEKKKLNLFKIFPVDQGMTSPEKGPQLTSPRLNIETPRIISQEEIGTKHPSVPSLKTQRLDTQTENRKSFFGSLFKSPRKKEENKN